MQTWRQVSRRAALEQAPGHGHGFEQRVVAEGLVQAAERHPASVLLRAIACCEQARHALTIELARELDTDSPTMKLDVHECELRSGSACKG